jgi:hypothetical protein
MIEESEHTLREYPLAKRRIGEQANCLDLDTSSFSGTLLKSTPLGVSKGE